MDLTSQKDYDQYIRQTPSGEYYVSIRSLTLRSRFQPIFDDAQEPIGFEALVLISDGESESLRPDVFFTDPKLEPSFCLAVELLSRAIHIRNFAREFSSDDKLLFINVLPNSLLTITSDMGFKDKSLLYKRLDALNLRTDNVVFEVIEQPCLEEENLKKAVVKLKNNGFYFAIDDFGAKYSNQDRVEQIRPDILKIDRGYLLNYCDGDQAPLIDAIALAKSIGAKTVIEGIETENQWQAIADLTFDYYQGYLLGRPHPIEFWGARYGKALR